MRGPVRREDLTPRQLQVIEATEPVVLVLGGPGTGKTTTALWAARDELSRPAVLSWQRVLFLTFSRTAVAQIAKRSPGVIGPESHRIEISTFHGFAWRLLRSFGRYGGQGIITPTLQSAARIKLLGQDKTRLTYDDLIPRMLALLKSETLQRLLTRRWPLVICDEFQDTDDDQWTVLATLARNARLLILADPNQMIYGFLKERGVSPKRLEHAHTIAGQIVELDRRSHRDPSGAIPAMAEAVRLRRFDDEAVLSAVRSSRMVVMASVADDALPSILKEQISRVRAEGARTVGVFGHSNEGVATLSAALTAIGLDHVLVGIGEAHAEALKAMATLCGYGAGLKTESEVRVAFAIFLTACTRGPRAPALAVQLATGKTLTPVLEKRLGELMTALRNAHDESFANLVSTAGQGWGAIGILGGARPWRRASIDFGLLARQVSGLPTEAAAALIEIAERRVTSVLVEFDPTKTGPVQLMNFHQTKGREADAVILVYRTGDYLSNRSDSEPYEESSRVLFVSLTRARNQVIVVLPDDPHPLVAPFVRLALRKAE